MRDTSTSTIQGNLAAEREKVTDAYRYLYLDEKYVYQSGNRQKCMKSAGGNEEKFWEKNKLQRSSQSVLMSSTSDDDRLGHLILWQEKIIFV